MEFGRIVARVDGEAWRSDPNPNALVAHYDPVSRYLRIGGHRQRHFGDYEIPEELDIWVCADPFPGTYQFAAVHNGPYGRYALALGAVGAFSMDIPISIEHGIFNDIEFRSSGGTENSLVIEELDLVTARIRGYFRFDALSPSGKYSLEARGRFAGYLAFISTPCAP